MIIVKFLGEDEEKKKEGGTLIENYPDKLDKVCDQDNFKESLAREEFQKIYIRHCVGSVHTRIFT